MKSIFLLYSVGINKLTINANLNIVLTSHFNNDNVSKLFTNIYNILITFTIRKNSTIFFYIMKKKKKLFPVA